MSNQEETIARDPASPVSEPTVLIADIHRGSAVADGVAFLNDAWAEEFDRRLAAWEAESRSVTPVVDSVIPASTY
jgi:hypothetical protein